MAYDSEDVRAYLRRRGIKANMARNPGNRRRPKPGRPYRLDIKAYGRMRGCVERFFAWLTGFRRLALRWERLASTFIGFIQTACIDNILESFEMSSSIERKIPKSCNFQRFMFESTAQKCSQQTLHPTGKSSFPHSKLFIVYTLVKFASF
ncbi:MAG: transposase [Candidatus Bathyarchaeia archaeon]